MPNNLEEDEICVGMRFDSSLNGKCKVLDILENGSFMIMNTFDKKEFHFRAMIVTIEELNKMTYLGIQKEPVQLGWVECLENFNEGLLVKGEKYRYFGTSRKYLFVETGYGHIDLRSRKFFKILNEGPGEEPVAVDHSLLNGLFNKEIDLLRDLTSIQMRGVTDRLDKLEGKSDG